MTAQICLVYPRVPLRGTRCHLGGCCNIPSECTMYEHWVLSLAHHSCAMLAGHAHGWKITSIILLLDSLLIPSLLYSNSCTYLYKFHSPQSFCEDVRQLVFGLYIFYDNSPIFNTLSNEMVDFVNVLDYVVMRYFLP